MTTLDTESNSQEYQPIPQPEEIPVREREDAMGAYLMMFAAWGAGLPLPIINLIASFIYYIVNKNKGRFVLFHVYQSLFTQVLISLMNASVIYWFIHIIFIRNDEYFNDEFVAYFFTVVAFNLIYFIISIIGAVKARKGKFYYIIFFGKLSYHLAYRIKEEKISTEPVNKPPGL
jgi:uncharacterized Tic20 family protein